MSIGNVTIFSPCSLAKRNSNSIVGSPFWLKLLSLYNLHPPASLRQLPLGSQSRLSTGEDLKMAAQIERPFQTLLDDCGVCNDFQTFLRDSTLVNPARFLAAIPRNIDDDLITQYRNNGRRPGIPELVNIRMVYTLCKDAEADAKATRAVVKASPETASIP